MEPPSAVGVVVGVGGIDPGLAFKDRQRAVQALILVRVELEVVGVAVGERSSFPK